MPEVGQAEIFEGADNLVAPLDMEVFQEEEELEDRETRDSEEESPVASEFPVSSEPELIAVIENSGDEPPTELEEVHLTSTVCDVCLELNLTHKTEAQRCERCEQQFCLHFASTVDVSYCVNCLSNISVTKQTISKEYVSQDANSKVTSIYRRKAREIKIGGQDWLFAQRKIVTLTDDELDLAIEYHRNILQLMINEETDRRNAKMHRYANTSYKIQSQAQTPGSTKTTTSTTVKKTRTVSKNKADAQMAALLASMAGKGKNVNDLMKLINSI